VSQEGVSHMELRCKNGPRTRPVAVPGYEHVALVLQGGGALGAYQAGVYRALDELALRPNWVAGISIGAVNAAIIAGSPPELRVSRLEEFWRSISHDSWWPWPPAGDGLRRFQNNFGVMYTALFGNPGLFRPRGLSPWLARPGTDAALSYYDPDPLRRTLERLVDFDRIRAGETRLSIGALNVRTGRTRYFDSAVDRIGPEHVLASSALPPTFPPVEIDGELYWDGGIESNTPLRAVLDALPRTDTLCFMIDLFSPDGTAPTRMNEVMPRQSDIAFASRSDSSVAEFKEKHELRRAIAALYSRLPERARNDPAVAALAEQGCTTTMNIVRLAYGASIPEVDLKDADFSRSSIEDRMRAGYEETISRCTQLRSRIRAPHLSGPSGVIIHDLAHEILLEAETGYAA
jgi:NTE family protein